ncbi:MAG: putative metallo-hydrolase [Chlamydiae bacterium]|nr:putative metallo-hydrolase [Chlamydiota bacterium]
MYEIIVSGPVSTNTILLFCPKTKQAAIVDPSFGSLEKIQQIVSENHLHISMILITHSHWDHVLDLAKVKLFYNVDVFAHKDDIPNLLDPGSDQLRAPIPMEKIDACKQLTHNQILPLGQLQIKVLHTPGHTPGSLCFYLENQQVLISGDTFFKNAIGRLDLPTARKEKMKDSLIMLSKLPPKTLVVPGHGPTTTIEKESWLKDPEKQFSLN